MGGEKLGVCVLGLGVGFTHAKSYNSIKDVNLYVCDLDPTRVKKAQEDLKNVAGVFSSVEETLASDKVDVVDISLPHNLHCPVVLKAAEAGKHCLVEKPMALTLAEADRMIVAAKEAGVTLAVAENYHFMPDTVRARIFINAGAVGKVFLIRVHELWQAHFPPSAWWNLRDIAGGGVVISLGIHLIRTLRRLGTSDVDRVFAVATDFSLENMEAEDTSVITVRFADGAIGNIVTSWATPHPVPEAHVQRNFSVHGTEGSIISPGDQTLRVWSENLESGTLKDAEMKIDLPKVDTFDLECKHFVECIKAGLEPENSGIEGRKDLEVAEAAYLSVKRGEAIKLPL